MEVARAEGFRHDWLDPTLIPRLACNLGAIACITEHYGEQKDYVKSRQSIGTHAIQLEYLPMVYGMKGHGILF